MLINRKKQVLFAFLLMSWMTCIGQNGLDKVSAGEPSQELIQAAEAQDINLVKTLLAQNMAVDAQDDDGYTALHYAVLKSNVPMVKLLLDAGADPNKANRFGNTPFYYSFSQGEPNIALTQLLLDYGADVNQRDKIGTTPLFRVVNFKKMSEVLKLLIAAGADVNAQLSAGGSTPLHQAALKGNKEAAEILIAHGANPAQKTAEGQTPADYARFMEHNDLAIFLEKAAA